MKTSMDDNVQSAKRRGRPPGIKPTRFCHGTCKEELPRELFPSNGEKLCKKCQSEKNKKRYRRKKYIQDKWSF